MKSVETIIREEIVLAEQQLGHSIPELAETLRKLDRNKIGDDEVRVYAKVLWDAYKRGGDQEVVDIYEELSGVQIQVLRQGRYVFAGLQTPSDYNIHKFVAEVQDNANHCPDEMPS